MPRALGRYELLRPLARGGMAEVFLARRRAAGIEKWLVVKRMRPETTGDPRFLDLFVREARLSMSLVHQNIVPVFDFGKIDNQVFLAMERVEGKDLGSSLARSASHRLPALLAAFIAAECCQALDYAHQRRGPDGVALGIVHRDVTPRNVLLSWSGEVKLTDFGIAALAGDANLRLLGTPHYMAPEQARSEPIDPRADIYAIGLVLREAVSGKRPRPGSDRDAILDAARRAELLPWSHATAGAEPPAGELALGSREQVPVASAGDTPPQALIAIIDRATAAAPDDRYPDARSMLEELDSFIVGQRAAHKAESPARQLAAWLAGVWEGARDDVESDATIQAEHLVSFLDDGAFDVLGTGTVRSLVATVAEDSHAELANPPAPPASPAPGSPARSVDAPLRAARISSSNLSVASGSFRTIAPPESRAERAKSADDAPATAATRPISQTITLVFVAVVVGAAVFLLTNRYRDRDPVPAQVAAGDPATGQPATGQPATGQPATRRPTGGRPATGRPTSGRPTNGALTNGQPKQDAGSASAPSGDPLPVVRVGINLIPWAYYTADGDPTRHETPSTLELAPGPHRLHVWNPELRIERDLQIDVPSGQATWNYSVALQP